MNVKNTPMTKIVVSSPKHASGKDKCFLNIECSWTSTFFRPKCARFDLNKSSSTVYRTTAVVYTRGGSGLERTADGIRLRCRRVKVHAFYPGGVARRFLQFAMNNKNLCIIYYYYYYCCTRYDTKSEKKKKCCPSVLVSNRSWKNT